MRRTPLTGRAGLALTLGLTLAATAATAHPTHDKAGSHGHDHDHGAEPPEPTAEQKKRRLERVVARAADRQQTLPQRRDDRRRALKRRLGRQLRDAPIADEVRAELETHARRVAWLRQIRYVAATKNDFDAVARVDRTLALENARHERWFRTELGAKR